MSAIFPDAAKNRFDDGSKIQQKMYGHMMM